MLGTYLVPGYLLPMTSEIEGILMHEFAEEMPTPTEFEQEVLRWKTKWEGCDLKSKSLLDAVNNCSDVFFPNIATVLQLLLAIPSGSCSCERSFSSLRRLKTWSRSTMGEGRLNGLALLYIHRNMPMVQCIDPLAILQKWDASMHRKIALAFN